MWAEKHGADRDEAAWRRFVRDRGRPLDAPDAAGVDAVRRSGLAAGR